MSASWLDEMRHYERQRDALARQVSQSPLRLTERGEFAACLALLLALVVTGWALLWLVAG